MTGTAPFFYWFREIPHVQPSVPDLSISLQIYICLQESACSICEHRNHDEILMAHWAYGIMAWHARASSTKDAGRELLRAADVSSSWVCCIPLNLSSPMYGKSDAFYWEPSHMYHTPAWKRLKLLAQLSCKVSLDRLQAGP